MHSSPILCFCLQPGRRQRLQGAPSASLPACMYSIMGQFQENTEQANSAVQYVAQGTGHAARCAHWRLLLRMHQQYSGKLSVIHQICSKKRQYFKFLFLIDGVAISVISSPFVS